MSEDINVTNDDLGESEQPDGTKVAVGQFGFDERIAFVDADGVEQHEHHQAHRYPRHAMLERCEVPEHGVDEQEQGAEGQQVVGEEGHGDAPQGWAMK